MLRRGFSGEERVWKVWWVGGIFVALAATALTLGAEVLRAGGHHAWGDFFDVLKLLVYTAWFACIWRSARNEANPVARSVARLAVAAGVVTAALTV